jgi:hypothetical protein
MVAEGNGIHKFSFSDVLLMLETAAFAVMSAAMAGVMLTESVVIHACSNDNPGEISCCCSHYRICTSCFTGEVSSNESISIT